MPATGRVPAPWVWVALAYTSCPGPAQDLQRLESKPSLSRAMPRAAGHRAGSCSRCPMSGDARALQHGYGWYRMRFAVAAARQLGLYLGQVSPATALQRRDVGDGGGRSPWFVTRRAAVHSCRPKPQGWARTRFRCAFVSIQPARQVGRCRDRSARGRRSPLRGHVFLARHGTRVINVAPIVTGVLAGLLRLRARPRARRMAFRGAGLVVDAQFSLHLGEAGAPLAAT